MKLLKNTYYSYKVRKTYYLKITARKGAAPRAIGNKKQKDSKGPD
jgi:hypothetical protein